MTKNQHSQHYAEELIFFPFPHITIMPLYLSAQINYVNYSAA